MKLWLDDERNPKDKEIQSLFGSNGDETWVKTASQAINRLKSKAVTFISLDHDLGPNAGTGLDVAKWIEEQAYYGNIPKLTWFVHSMNPVGNQNIVNCLSKADEYWQNSFKKESN
jgi:hypothetical protein